MVNGRATRSYTEDSRNTRRMADGKWLLINGKEENGRKETGNGKRDLGMRPMLRYTSVFSGSCLPDKQAGGPDSQDKSQDKSQGMHAGMLGLGCHPYSVISSKSRFFRDESRDRFRSE